MGKKIYVGNISWTSTEDDLKKFFSPFGNVKSAVIVREKIEDGLGRSRGFGFVEMESEDEVRDAIEMTDGKEFMGRTIKVNEAHERSHGDSNRAKMRQREDY